jgi:hypothetical protein
LATESVDFSVNWAMKNAMLAAAPVRLSVFKAFFIALNIDPKALLR